MGYQSKTYSLSDEVVDAIERAKAGGTSPNKFLRELLGFENQGRVLAMAAIAEAERAVRAETQMSGAETISVPEHGFPIKCQHCGESGARGASKWASICFGCKAGGHTNQPAECPRCTEGQSI